jgi:hypothetical protein
MPGVAAEGLLPLARTLPIPELRQVALDRRELAAAEAARQNGLLSEARITGLRDE